MKIFPAIREMNATLVEEVSGCVGNGESIWNIDWQNGWVEGEIVAKGVKTCS